MAGLFRRLLNFAIAEDEAANALVVGGSARETVSGSIGRAAGRGSWLAAHVALPFVNWLMRNPQHCQDAAADEARWRAQTGGQV